MRNGHKRRAPKSKGADLLFKFVDANGISYAQLGKDLGVSRVTASDWAAGFKRPSEPNRVAIETWTSGAVPASAWERASERKAVAAVEPWSPSKTGTGN